MVIYISRKRKGELEEEEIDRLFWNFIEMSDEYKNGSIDREELYNFYKWGDCSTINFYLSFLLQKKNVILSDKAYNFQQYTIKNKYAGESLHSVESKEIAFNHRSVVLVFWWKYIQQHILLNSSNTAFPLFLLSLFVFL